MKRFTLIFISLIFTATALMAGPVLKGRVLCGGKGLQGVVVSDGVNCVTTDAKGRYCIEADSDSRFLFVSTPSGYLPKRVEGTIPVFYKEIAVAEDWDFILEKNPVDDGRHVFFVQTDVQLVAEANLAGYAKVLKDLKEYADGLEGVDVFSLDCGDIVGDTPSLFPGYKATVAQIDMPVYRAIGNHDMNYYGRTFETSYRTFENYFGPVCYSFNRGKVHYIVLDNTFYIGRDYFYMGYVDERTFKWLERDLSYVPKGSTVVVSMHIPSRLTPERKPFVYDYPSLADQTVNSAALHAMFEGYNTHIITGHMHYNLNICFGEKLMEHNTASVCGTWWCTPVCLDGTPAGYGVYKVDGDEIRWLYKSAGYPESYQGRAYLPGASPEHPECIVANVWNYDPQWKVEWCENGAVMGEMQKYTGFDPYSAIMCKDKSRITYDWIGPTPTEHLFKAQPVDTAAVMEVRVTDRFGNVSVIPVGELVYP